MENFTFAYLSLGSNLGDRIENIEFALIELEKKTGLDICQKSSIYESEPFGPKDQPDFLNIVVKVNTSLDAFYLLSVCKETEIYVGRKPRNKWREREIDIDIIFYNYTVIESELLNIPHKEFQNRRFVLEPLNEIASDFICPLSGKTISSLLDSCKDTSKIKRIN